MLVQQPLGVFQGDPFCNRYQIFFGHHIRNIFFKIGFKSQIPVSDNPHQLVAFGHRHP